MVRKIRSNLYSSVTIVPTHTLTLFSAVLDGYDCAVRGNGSVDQRQFSPAKVLLFQVVLTGPFHSGRESRSCLRSSRRSLSVPLGRACGKLGKLPGLLPWSPGEVSAARMSSRQRLTWGNRRRYALDRTGSRATNRVSLYCSLRYVLFHNVLHDEQLDQG